MSVSGSERARALLSETSYETAAENLVKSLGFELRPVQRDALIKIISFIMSTKNDSKCKVIAVNAPTGMGKTLIALSAAWLLRDELSTMIFVRTRNQLTSFVRDAMKFFKIYPPVAVAKTKACLVAETDDAEFMPCKTCDLRKTPMPDDYKMIVDTVAKLGTYDPYKIVEWMKSNNVKLCPYFVLKRLSSVTSCPFRIYTYPYMFRDFLTEIAFKELADDRDLRPESLREDVKLMAVVDEAHNIESAALSTEISVSKTVVERAGKEIGRYVSLSYVRRHEDLFRALGDVLKLLLDKLSELERRKAEEIVVKPFVEEIEKIVRSYGYDYDDFVSDLRDIVVAIYEAKRITRERARSYLNTIRKLLLVMKHVDNNNVVLTYDKGHLEVRRTDPTVIYDSYLSKFNYVILMSGTLPAREYMTTIWSVPEDKLLYLDYSNVPFGKVMKKIVHGVTSKYTERNEKTYRKYAEYIVMTYRRARANVLVLTPCYEFAANVYRLLPEDVRKVTILETPDVKIGDVEAKARKERLVLLAVSRGKLCEGIELVDDNGRSLISDVVIAGIPYPRPTEYQKIVESKIVKRVSKDGRDAEVKLWLYRNIQAWIQVRQACGRSIRHPEDSATWWLVDNRFEMPFWKVNLLDK